MTFRRLWYQLLPTWETRNRTVVVNYRLLASIWSFIGSSSGWSITVLNTDCQIFGKRYVISVKRDARMGSSSAETFRDNATGTTGVMSALSKCVGGLMLALPPQYAWDRHWCCQEPCCNVKSSSMVIDRSRMVSTPMAFQSDFSKLGTRNPLDKGYPAATLCLFVVTYLIPWVTRTAHQWFWYN